jgi:hypothetical protein
MSIIKSSKAEREREREKKKSNLFFCSQKKWKKVLLGVFACA